MISYEKHTHYVRFSNTFCRRSNFSDLWFHTAAEILSRIIFTPVFIRSPKSSWMHVKGRHMHELGGGRELYETKKFYQTATLKALNSSKKVVPNMKNNFWRWGTVIKFIFREMISSMEFSFGALFLRCHQIMLHENTFFLNWDFQNFWKTREN